MLTPCYKKMKKSTYGKKKEKSENKRLVKGCLLWAFTGVRQQCVQILQRS